MLVLAVALLVIGDSERRIAEEDEDCLAALSSPREPLRGSENGGESLKGDDSAIGGMEGLRLKGATS